MRQGLIDHYAGMADHERVRRARQSQTSDGLHPMTKGWERYRPDVIPVPIRDAWGNVRLVTPNQAQVLAVARTHEGETIRATVIASSLGVATSTVTRALVRLAAYGLVAYDTVRGRFGGITFLSTAWADIRMRSRSAWSRIRDERGKAWQRYLRKLDTSLYWWSGLDAKVNVASNTPMDATLTGS